MTSCRLCGPTAWSAWWISVRPRRANVFLTAEQLDEPEIDLSAAPAAVPGVSAGADPAADHPGGHVHRVRLLLVVLDVVGGARRAASSRRGRRGWVWTPDSLRRRGRQQRRLPAAARRRRRHPLPRRRTLGERRRRPRASKGVPTVTAFLDQETGAAGARRARAGRPGRRQQRLRAHPGPRRLHPGPARRWSPTTAGCRSRCSTC